MFGGSNLVPRLSSLPPLVVKRKTLVAAGHVTTQNLGGEKNLVEQRMNSEV